MAWKVELTPLAERNLAKLDPQIARRILSFLHGRLACWMILEAWVRL